jgi:hypothetical protein
MATDTARSSTPPAARHLWQVPALVLGVAAVIAVLTLRPYSPDTAAAAEHQLREARRALEQSPPDAATALQRADRVLALADRYPQLAGEAHFLAGSAHLRLADDPATPDAARERQLAHQDLDQAAALHVSEADQPKLNYRLAKVALLLGGDPAKAVSLLEKSVDIDDPAEGYGLLALAYSRLTPPDLNKAVEASMKQLDRALRTSDTRLQASARFRVGELYLQLKKVKDGRLMLSKVSTEAAPDEFYKARMLLAESYEETPQDWDGAARNWELAQQNPKLTGAEKAKVLYHLGLCAARAQRKDAAGVFAQAVALGGPEGQAAGLRLGELKLESDPAAAVAALAAALQPVHGPDDYHNPLVPIEDVRQDVEKAVRGAQDKADWDLVRNALEVYARVAMPGKDDELAGQAFDAQGQALTEKAKADAANQATLVEQANEAFRQAAAAYERAAGKAADPAGQGAAFWQAAQLALKAGQSVRARDILVKATQVESALTAEKTAEAWLLIATTDQLNQRTADARTAFQHCLSAPGPFALKARLGLAEIDVAESRFDDAERALQQVLKEAREAPQPDAGLQEQATYDAARLAYARQAAVKEELRDFTTAEQRLLGAIEQYPTSLQAPAARRLLGLAYWTDARLKGEALRTPGLSEEERRTYRQRRVELLLKSAENFEKAEEQLLARQRAGALSPKEAQYLKETSFWGADCYYWFPRYEESIRRYGTLALRYQGLPEELIALNMLHLSYWNNGQSDKAMGTLKRLQETVEKMPESAFDGSMSTHKRDYWVKLLAEINKPAIPPAPPRAPAGK